MISKNKTKKILIGISAVLFWIAVWWIAAAIIGRELVLPDPLQSVRALVRIASGADFWRSCLLSLARILVGFACGVVFGAICGIASRSRVLDALITPIMTVIRCVPVASFIILAWYFLSRSSVPVFTSFLMVAPVMWVSVKTGIAAVDDQMKEVGSIFHLSLGRRIRHIWLPPLSSHFLSGATSALGLSWKAGVAAEVLCQPNYSIGRNIYLTKSYLETAELFAWTLVVVLLSLCLEAIFKAVVRKKNDRS